MKNQKQNTLFYIILVVIVLIFVTYFITANYLNTTDDSFTREYAIFLNDLNIAEALLFYGQQNLNLGSSYIYDEEYYYDFAVDYYNKAKEQSLEAKEKLLFYKNKLPLMKENAPSQFFITEIDNRLEQIDRLLVYEEGIYALSDNMAKQLYEINYGSESRAADLFDEYEFLRLEFNRGLENLNNIQRKIDAHWEKNWYPEIDLSIE